MRPGTRLLQIGHSKSPFLHHIGNNLFDWAASAQIWRSEEEAPSILLPQKSRMGMVAPIKGPTTYQGQGPSKKSVISFIGHQDFYKDIGACKREAN